MHYHQAAETLLANGPIMAKIGPFDDNKYCEAILNGTFDISNIDEMTVVKELVLGMDYPDPQKLTPLFDTTIMDDEFFKAIYHTQEQTLLSPSGHHYRHYCTSMHEPSFLGCIALFANFCFQWGIILE